MPRDGDGRKRQRDEGPRVHVSIYMQVIKEEKEKNAWGLFLRSTLQISSFTASIRKETIFVQNIHCCRRKCLFHDSISDFGVNPNTHARDYSDHRVNTNTS